MRRFLAQASGGVLGFIGGNTRGAVYGYKAGGALYDWKFGGKGEMPPIPRRFRKRTRSVAISRSRSRSRKRVAYFGRRRPVGGATRTRRVALYGGKARRRRMTRGAFGPTSNFRLRLRKGIRQPKGYRKVGAPRHVNSIVTTTISSSPQLQGSGVISLFDQGTGLTTGVAVAVPGRIDTEQLVANIVADESGVALDTLRYFIPYIKLKIRCRNMTTGPLDVLLYDCVARRDQEFAATFDENMRYDPYTAWQTGMAHEGLGDLGTRPADINFPGMTPFESEKFCQYWHVRGVTKRTLGAGEEHCHYVTLSLNRLHNREFTQDLSAYVCESYSCLCTIKSGIYHIQGTTEGTAVLYGQGRLDVVTEYHAMCQSMQKNRTVVTNYQSLAVFTGSLEQVVEDTDVVAVEDVAGNP